jgi:hypothetical protein
MAWKVACSELARGCSELARGSSVIARGCAVLAGSSTTSTILALCSLAKGLDLTGANLGEGTSPELTELTGLAGGLAEFIGLTGLTGLCGLELLGLAGRSSGAAEIVIWGGGPTLKIAGGAIGEDGAEIIGVLGVDSTLGADSPAGRYWGFT